MKCATPSSVALLLVGAGATKADRGTKVDNTLIIYLLKNFQN